MKARFRNLIIALGIGVAPVIMIPAVANAAPAKTASHHVSVVGTGCPSGTLPATVRRTASGGYTTPQGAGAVLLRSGSVTQPYAPFGEYLQVADFRTTPVTTIYKVVWTLSIIGQADDVEVESYVPTGQGYFYGIFATFPVLDMYGNPTYDTHGNPIFDPLVKSVKACVGLGGFGEQENPDFTLPPPV